MEAWSQMFNEYLTCAAGDVLRPYSDADYFAHVDGKPRYDGVRDFLASRGRRLPEGTPGKPAPDTYAYAARALGVLNGRAAVFEDAISGVAAGRAGGFGVVVGVDRGVGSGALRAAGADVVVRDLGDLVR